VRTVFSIPGARGQTRLALHVCPNRLIGPDEQFLVDYVVKAAQRGMHGEFIALRDWPLRGGLMKQPARLVAATDLILQELAAIQAVCLERARDEQQQQRMRSRGAGSQR
jgi:hypothetical protein